jgi:hypothetical protein
VRNRDRWLAAFIALVLHAGLLWIFLERPPTRTASADVVIIDAVLLDPPALPGLDAITANATADPVVQPTPVPRPSAPNPAASSPSRGLLAHGETSPERFGYLPFDEVDQAAEPVGDWVIDTDMLPRGASLRVVLQLWVSAAGGIDRWDLVGDTDSTTRARRALSDLARTPMQPAFRDQLPVASFRQLELILQGN